MTKYFFLILFFLITKINAQYSERDLSSHIWKFKNHKDKNWFSAKIPGTLHTDLMQNKIIEDPFLDKNEVKVQWIENEDWDYKTDFIISKEELQNENIDLLFEGLDTFSSIILNGKHLGQTDNMFREWKYSVKKYLKIGKNDLLIQFKSPVRIGDSLAQFVPFKMPESPRSFVRKAQYQFGWDWGPRLVTSGIWKPIKLQFWNHSTLESIQHQFSIAASGKRDFVFKCIIRSTKEVFLEFMINQSKKSIKVKKGLNEIIVPYDVSNLQLWQPNGWGKQNLHSFTFQLLESKKVLEKKELTIGLRTIELIQEKEGKGSSFYFKVNGKPLYAKGVNWIPADSFSTRVSKDKYQKLIADCKAAHMNMIRIWGGGIYEDEEFYKACDENGILVWQDFMFAGSFYPADDAFLDNVKQEIKDQVKRLQNHPSIALWCGNNEIDEAIVNWGYQKQLKYSKQDSLKVWADYKKLFHKVIPETLDQLLPKNKNLYWPSSPSIGWGHAESVLKGDSHYWGVWWGEFPFEIYRDKVGRFMSEYGFQGMPSLETIKAMYTVKPLLQLDDEIFKHHQKNKRGLEIINNYMQRDYKIPKNFDGYVYTSQLLQARGMQIAIEAHRTAKPYNMGTLYWQLNDCWPVISWSSIDYLGNWKASHYQIKRSFEPILISAVLDLENKLSVSVINDEFNDFKNIQLKTSIYHLNGNKLDEFYETDQTLKSNSVLKYQSVDLKQLIGNDNLQSVVIHYQILDDKGLVITDKIFFPSKPKDLQLSEPHFKIKKISDFEIEITSDVVAKDVHVIGSSHFSDNYFDLLSNSPKKIKSDLPIKNIEIRSLWEVLNE